MPDNQLAQLKAEKGYGIHVGTLIAPGKLPYTTLSLPNMVVPQPLELCNYMADFGVVGFFFIQSGLIGQQG